MAHNYINIQGIIFLVHMVTVQYNFRKQLCSSSYVHTHHSNFIRRSTILFAESHLNDSALLETYVSCLQNGVRNWTHKHQSLIGSSAMPYAPSSSIRHLPVTRLQFSRPSCYYHPLSYLRFELFQGLNGRWSASQKNLAVSYIQGLWHFFHIVNTGRLCAER